MRRIIGIVLSLVLVGLIGGALYIGLRSSSSSQQLVEVRGLSGSEKKEFFNSPEVREAFAARGYRLNVDYAGSREIADQDFSSYDFVFPASSPSAERIKTQRKNEVKKTFTPFFTPMVVASWEPVVGLLEKNGVVRQESSATVLDVKAYLELVESGKRWNQLEGGKEAYNANKKVLISTTDVRKSNSAAMYLALTSYVANGDKVVTAKAQQDAITPTVGSLFLDQGFVENTSSGPFGSYLSVGMGKTPMVFAYESQFLSRQMAGDGSIQPNMKLMYPSPTLMSKQVFVATSDQGSAVGALLQDDEEFGKLAAAHGFRPDSPKVFADALKAKNVEQPPALVNVISPPSYEVLESMITTIEGYYKNGSVPAGGAGGPTQDPKASSTGDSETTTPTTSKPNETTNPDQKSSTSKP